MKSTPARNAWAPRCCATLSVIWNIRLSRPCGLEGNVPNVAEPATLTAGPIGSVGSASRSECVNWRAGLVHRPRADGERIAERNRLIGVVQAGRRRRRAEPAGAARIRGGDVVQAVADAHLVAAVERVIDLAPAGSGCRSAGRRGRSQPVRRGNPRRQPRVDDRGIGVGDRRQAGLIEQPLLGVHEVERAAPSRSGRPGCRRTVAATSAASCPRARWPH